ncbi:MAG: HD-GYP domain-containing protein [Clostridiales bacterium]|nr:HD-GYP domain-containing protein [Clostridiales bacterium]
MFKWLKATWHELSQSIFVGDRLEKNMKAITLISIICSIFGLVMVVINIIQDSGYVVISSWIFFAAGLISAFASGFFKARKVSMYLAIGGSISIFTYYAISGAMDGFSVIWATLMPIGVSYFLSVRAGIIVSVYYEILLCVLFYTPLRNVMSQYYSDTIMTRYPIVFMILSLFTIVAMVQYHKMVLRDNDYMERLGEEVRKQTSVALERADKLEKMSDEIVNTLAIAIDAKDRYTNGHSFRVAAYSVALAKHLAWSDDKIKIMHHEALLHDIGKIGVSDTVLNKPGKLTDEEFEIIKSHSTIGGTILDASENLKPAADVARYHHERYDGKGYPSGLKGEEIPFPARIVSIADAYDAMRSDRIYRKGLPKEIIRQELVRGRGKQFDPDLLDIFLQMEDTGELDEVCETANKQMTSVIERSLIEKLNKHETEKEAKA